MITVLLFAGLAEAANCNEMRLNVEQMTVLQLKKRMIESVPAIENLLGRSLTAVNKGYAANHTVVVSGDEVAFIPPVSGG